MLQVLNKILDKLEEISDYQRHIIKEIAVLNEKVAYLLDSETSNKSSTRSVRVSAQSRSNPRIVH